MDRQQESGTIEPAFFSTHTLAAYLDVSRKFIEKHRNKIAGAHKIAGVWRFRKMDIERALATKGTIILK